jgi:hypothetical protein
MKHCYARPAATGYRRYKRIIRAERAIEIEVGDNAVFHELE